MPVIIIMKSHMANSEVTNRFAAGVVLHCLATLGFRVILMMFARGLNNKER